MSDSTTTICGNITRDPELKYTPTGQAVVTFGVAVNRRWQNRTTQEWEEQVSFFNIVAWRELAENAAETLHKGDRVVVFGEPEQRSWETTEGEKRSVVEFRANDIAPSLRWSTAVLTKTHQSGATTRPPHPADAQLPGTGDAPRPDPFPDEEPF